MFAVISLPPGVTNVITHCLNRFAHLDHLGEVDWEKKPSPNDFRTNLARTKAIIPARQIDIDNEPDALFLASYPAFLAYLGVNAAAWEDVEDEAGS